MTLQLVLLQVSRLKISVTTEGPETVSNSQSRFSFSVINIKRASHPRSHSGPSVLIPVPDSKGLLKVTIIAVLCLSYLEGYNLASHHGIGLLIIFNICVKTSFKHKSVEVLPRDFIDSFICFEPVLCTYHSLIVSLRLLRAGSRMIFCIAYLYFLQRPVTRHSRRFGRKMKSVFQITVLGLSGLIAVSSFNCPLAATETVTSRRGSPVRNAVPITSAPHSRSTKITDSSGDYMTISITIIYGTQLSLSFASNAGGPSPLGNPLATVLLNASPTQYVFPTGWAGRIYVFLNTNPLGSKVEGSIINPPDIDISYVDGYSVPITCFSEGVPVSGCNIDLFK